MSPNSSLCFASDRVFALANPADLVCVDAKAGKLLWRKSNTFADLQPPIADREIKGNAGNTVPTPVTDGRFVYVVFGSGIVACYDLDGGRKWIRYFDLPTPQQYGRAASPVLAAGKLIVSIKHLHALDPATGQTLWQAEKATEGYGTSAVAKIADADILVTTSGHVVRAADGTILVSDLAETKYTSPIVAGGVAYFIDASAAAFRLPAKAEPVAKIKPIWEQDFEDEFFASPVFHDGLIYTAGNKGKFYVVDARDGKIVLEKELEIPNMSGKPGVPVGNIYPSMSLAGGRLFFGNDRGDLIVAQPGRQWRQEQVNHLSATSGNTPIFIGSRIYLRGDDRIFCIGK